MKKLDDVWKIAIDELMIGECNSWIIKQIREQLLSINRGAVLEYDFSCIGLKPLPENDCEVIENDLFLSYLQKIWAILRKYKLITTTFVDSSRY